MRPDFQSWLRRVPPISLAAQHDAVSRCRRVEKWEGDLDQHFVADRIGKLLGRLSYSHEDEKSGLHPRHSVPFSTGASIGQGTNAVASAVRLYFRFCEEIGREPSSFGQGPSVAPSPVPGRAADTVRAPVVARESLPGKGYQVGSVDGSLVEAIIREGIWLPPILLHSLPLLRPYAIRDNACRPRRTGTIREDQWGLPDAEGFFRDDNSLIKSMPCSFPVVGGHRFVGRKIAGGFVASHAWRAVIGGTSHANPLAYSFIGNIVWLPTELATETDQEGGLGQNILKALAWSQYRSIPTGRNSASLLEKIWASLPKPDLSLLPSDFAVRLSHFDVDVPRFVAANTGLIRALLMALTIVDRTGSSAVLDKIRYERMSLATRYSTNLPLRYESSRGFVRLKSTLREVLACQE